MALSEREELELLELEEKEHKNGFTQEKPAAPPESFGHGLMRGALSVLPVAGMLAGGTVGSGAGPVGTVGGAGLGYAAGKELEGLGRQHLLGEAPPSTNPVDQAKRVGQNTLEGSASEMGGQVLGKAPAVASYIGNKLRGGAEGLARIASGVSRAKAASNTGAELLDQWIVRPFSLKSGIQNRANQAVSAAGDTEKEALASVPGGVTRTPLLASIDSKIAELKRMPGNETAIKRLENIRDNFGSQPNFRKYSATDLNQISQNYKGVKGDQIQPILGEQSEKLISEGNPSAGDAIEGARSTQAGLRPVVDGSKENMLTGLATDAGLIGLGEGFDALTHRRNGTGFALAGARHFAKAPGASTGAVAANMASKAVGALGQIPEQAAAGVGRMAAAAIADRKGSDNPQEDTVSIRDTRLDAPEVTDKLSRRQANALSGSKYADVILDASKRGKDAVSTAHFLLSQSDPAYQELMKKAQDQ